MEYKIRFAEKSDAGSIMEFIDKNWRKGHILSRDRKLFDWQYGRRDDDRLNIVLGLDENNEIQGMLGFVQYDNCDTKDIALALWKANPSTGFLGIKLIGFLFDNEPHREVVCPGINMSTTSKIYEHLDMKVGAMSQWYRLRAKKTYRIAGITDATVPGYDCRLKGELVLLQTMEDFEETFNNNSEPYKNSIPFKSFSYIRYRYYEHPSYKYRLYALKESEKKADTVFVFRIQECNGSSVLRMVDCIGDIENLYNITGSIDRLLEENDSEYADFYSVGTNEDGLIKAGWRMVENEGNIIPDYFSPFEQRKVDIYYATSDCDAVLFKGDGDQDRPN